jgi:hypothetical protein
MIKEIITITEHHKNGALFYKERRAIIEPLFIDAYRSFATFRSIESISFLKIECTKYFDNGQLAWSLIWDEKGELINKNDLQYRKDGTIIQT